jgi:glycosyltransferase involved in cell wall biosynthesis
MTRVLLVCPEPLGHGQPAGIGIRFLEMTRVLLADGHRVTVMSLDAGHVPGATAVPLAPEAIAHETAQADMIVVQGHAANDLFAHGSPRPTVVDLYDPYIVENLHYYAQRGAEVFTHDHATLIRSLLQGDFFLCASDAQRLFYLGVLLAAGRLNPIAFESDPRFERLIAIAPFGVQAPRQRHDSATPAILFGGIYDWYDPILAIDAVAIARQSVPEVSLTFTTHPNPELTPQGKTAEAIAYVERKGYGSFVRFEPWFAYERRAEFFDRFRLSLTTFRQSIETDLSMRTRVYDYLWGGLPIITSQAPGLDAELVRFEAGEVVDSDSPEFYASSIVKSLTDADKYARLVDGTRRFVMQHQWSRTLEPLRAFCRAPRVDTTKETFAMQMNVPEQPRSLLSRIRRRIGGSF